MKKNIICLWIIVTLGCSSNSGHLSQSELAKEETMLKQSGDLSALQGFYERHVQDNREYLSELIRISVSQQDFQTARIYINTMSDEEKSEPRNWMTLARYYYGVDNCALAESYLEKNIYRLSKQQDGVEELSSSYALQGKCLMNRGLYSEAIEVFSKGIELGFNRVELKNNMAVGYMKIGDYNSAFSLLSSEYNLGSRDKDIAVNLAVVLIHENKSRIAKKVLDENFNKEMARKIYHTVSKVNFAESEVTEHHLTNNDRVNSTAKIKSKAKINDKYEIQVLAKKNPLSDHEKEWLYNISKVWLVFKNEGITKYCLGTFDTIEEAKERITEKSLSNAFIVQYKSEDYEVLNLTTEDMDV
ncbi:flp pilus assembly protein tadD [Vibrio sp. JCM 19236]|nr:flp pilus assembly protein tadD [Vibrio sp. JCM 19236]